jgi:AraC-like DNA-binding protein
MSSTTMMETTPKRLIYFSNGSEQLSIPSDRPKFIEPKIWECLKYYSRLRKILGYLESNSDHPTRLIDLARVSCMSPTSLSRMFRTKTGITLQRFLSAYKISKAHEMIVTSDASVTEIASALGFANLSTFERTFRRITGQAPSKYRAVCLLEQGILRRQMPEGVEY